MKKQILLGCCTLAALLMTACAGQVAYVISGTWDEGQGKYVYLSQEVAKHTYQVIDSMQLSEDLSFTFRGAVPYEQKMIVTFGQSGVAGQLKAREQEIYIDGTPIVITAKKGEKTVFDDSGIEVVVAGSSQQPILDAIAGLQLTNMFMQLGDAFAPKSDDPHIRDSVSAARKATHAAFDKQLLHFVDSVRECPAVLYVIDGFMSTYYPLETIDSLFNTLSDRVKNSQLGKDFKLKIANMKAVNMGSIAPDFELPRPDGTMLKLSSLRGKIVLIDFWASWCGPCRGEMPNVKAIYEKHKESGFEVLGVSLDESRQQWLAAIEQEQLPWPQVSSLSGWACPVAKQYNVTAIPRLYILDAEGKIVGMDLRGDDLAARIDELFAQ